MTKKKTCKDCSWWHDCPIDYYWHTCIGQESRENCKPGLVMECVPHRVFRILRDEIRRLRAENTKLVVRLLSPEVFREQMNVKELSGLKEEIRKLRGLVCCIADDVAAYDTLEGKETPTLDSWRNEIEACANEKELPNNKETP